jgi:hypothetical protein
MKIIRKIAQSALASVNLKIVNAKTNSGIPIELTKEEAGIIDYVVGNGLTSASRARVASTIAACRYAVDRSLGFPFVECGTWRGGNAIAAAMTFDLYQAENEIWIYDTFAGMTAPGKRDRNAHSNEDVERKYRRRIDGANVDWCFASKADVIGNVERAGLEISRFRLIEGDVLSTLVLPENLPEAISVLRLDTDWYESTLQELRVLYPLLSNSGVLLIDDYGHWEGARAAVDEYFVSFPPRPLLSAVDYTGRVGVKSV